MDIINAIEINSYFTDTELEKLYQEIHKFNKAKRIEHTQFGAEAHDDLQEKNGKIFHYGDHTNSLFYDLIIKRLPPITTDKIIIDAIYHLQSYYPYHLHSDYSWMNCNTNEIPFLVIIIPLESVNAHTIVTNQIMTENDFYLYLQNSTGIKKLKTLTDLEYETYLSHCDPVIIPYISIQKTFKWNAGSMLIMGAKQVHSSDNYLLHGLQEKNCITLFCKKQIS